MYKKHVIKIRYSFVMVLLNFRIPLFLLIEIYITNVACVCFEFIPKYLPLFCIYKKIARALRFVYGV